MQDDLIKPAAAAQMLGVTTGWLAADRRREVPRLPFLRLGPRTNRYSRPVLAEIIAGIARCGSLEAAAKRYRRDETEAHILRLKAEGKLATIERPTLAPDSALGVLVDR